MSRSGYSDGADGWELIRWRGAVKSALRGKRGQAFLHELLAALDALPEKKLIARELREPSGAVCAIGAVGVARGIDMTPIDPEDSHLIARAFGISRALACEIEFINDDDFAYRATETPEKRFERVRRWVVGQIEKPGTDG